MTNTIVMRKGRKSGFFIYSNITKHLNELDAQQEVRLAVLAPTGQVQPFKGTSL